MRIQVYRRRHQFGCGIPVFRGYEQYGGNPLIDLATVATGPVGLVFRELLKSRQNGNGVSVYRGAERYQYGHGLGDILRSIGKFAAPFIRRAMPVLFKTGKKLVKTAIKNREQGRTWGESFREGLAPAAHTALKEITTPDQPQVEQVENQDGKGFSFRRKHHRMYKSNHRVSPMHINF